MPTKKILITYASKAGSTAEVARFMQKVMQENELSADLLPIEKVKNIAPYDKIYIGSPIYIGRWRKPARKFIEKQQALLQNKEVYYWLTCLSLTEDDSEKLAAVENYLATERKLVVPKAEGRFGGVIDLKKLSFLERKMIKAVGSPIGDFRDWDKIAAWTKSTFDQSHE
ncbi:MAG: flavodoxin domain-containing protein [Candidatus Cloacimonadales bacterium]